MDVSEWPHLGDELLTLTEDNRKVYYYCSASFQKSRNPTVEETGSHVVLDVKMCVVFDVTMNRVYQTKENMWMEKNSFTQSLRVSYVFILVFGMSSHSFSVFSRRIFSFILCRWFSLNILPVSVKHGISQSFSYLYYYHWEQINPLEYMQFWCRITFSSHQRHNHRLNQKWKKLSLFCFPFSSLYIMIINSFPVKCRTEWGNLLTQQTNLAWIWCDRWIDLRQTWPSVRFVFLLHWLWCCQERKDQLQHLFDMLCISGAWILMRSMSSSMTW